MVGMNAVEVAMGYYRRAFAGLDERVWQEHWVRDCTAAELKGRLVLGEEVVLIARDTRYPGPIVPGASFLRSVLPDEVWRSGLYVHLACGRLGALAEMVRDGRLDLWLWRWCCWQRGLRSARWHWGETGRMVEKLSRMNDKERRTIYE